MFKRFEKDPELAKAYHEFIQEYQDLKHMEVLSKADIDDKKCNLFLTIEFSRKIRLRFV